MDFYVYDDNLNVVGIIDNYTSVIWTLRYNDVGDFEIYIRSTPDVLELCRINRYIVRESDGTVMIIKSITQAESAENGDYITITGVSVESVLSQRVVWAYTELMGRVEECIYSLVNTNCINPLQQDRIIPKLTTAPLKHFTPEISQTKYSGMNVLEAVKQLCEVGHYGFRIITKNKKLVFEVYAGVDHSRNQTENLYIVFDGENITESTYTNDYNQYKNVARVGGTGEGLYQIFASYGDASGLSRFETYAEDTSISNTELLQSTGRNVLQETTPIKTFDGELSNYYTYDVDYSLGDIVQIENKNGISATARITEITQSIDDSGIYTIPTFTEWEVVQND